MSRSRPPKCPTGRARCRVCTDSVGVAARIRDATDNGATEQALTDHAALWDVDSGVWDMRGCNCCDPCVHREGPREGEGWSLTAEGQE